jgi:hypothetical protein
MHKLSRKLVLRRDTLRILDKNLGRVGGGAIRTQGYTCAYNCTYSCHGWTCGDSIVVCCS